MSDMTTSISGVSTTSDIVSAAATGSAELDKQTFLRLLTTQLQNQDPTEPMTNQEFVAQLATFSQLEQMQTLNDQVESLYLVNTSMNNATLSNMLGKTVVAESDTFHYDGEGDQDIHYDAEGAATSATLTITDDTGSVVWTGSLGALESGEGSYTWNGLDSSGQQLEEGNYTFSVTATDSDGETVEVTELIRGVCDEMAFDSGLASPSVDGIQVDMADIVRLYTEDSE